MNKTLGILLLEDSAADAELVEHELRKSGLQFELKRAQTEQEFLDALQSSPPDVILADYMLPAFTGMEAVKALNERKLEIPYITLSGGTGEETAVDLMWEGATDYVSKNHLANMVPAIQRALREVENKNQKRRAENSLRVSEARFRAIFDAAGAGIALENMQGGIIEANRTLQQMLGYTAQELQQLTRKDFTHEQDQGRETEFLHKLLTGESEHYQMEKRFVRKDGRIIWGRQTVSLAHDGSGQAQFSLVMIEDITERQRAEEAHLQYAAIVESSNDAIISQTFDGIIFSWNPAAERVYGYSAPEANGRSVSIIVPPDREQELSEILEQIKHGERVDNFETTRLRQDGRVIHVSVTTSPIKDLSGKIIGASAISRDITERKLAEQALRESEASLARAQRIAGLGSWELDLRARKLAWSDETYRIFGVKRDECQCSPELFYKLVHPEDRKAIENALDDAIQKNSYYHADHRIILPNGEIKTVSEQAEIIRDEKGEPIRCVGTVLDITERKRAENFNTAFSKLGQRLSSASTAVEAARIIAEEAGKLFGWDACNLQLCSSDLQRFHTILNMDLIDGMRRSVPIPAHNFKPSARLRLVIEQGAQLVLREPNKPDPHAQPFGNESKPSASIMYVPVRNGPKIVGVFSIHSYSANAYTQKDLEILQALADHCGGALERIRVETDRVNLENQLRQSQKMESVGQLAGGIAHDFNNILTIIQGHTSLLTMYGELSESAKDSAQQISVAAERAANLTRQLLTFSRRQVMQPKNLDLNEVVNTMSKMLRRLLGEDITLHVSYTPCLPLIHADPGMMEQILMNLSVNARDAMPKGGRLFINTSVITVDDTYSQQVPEARAGDYVCLSVRDTGTGISPEILPHIFEPFFTTKDVGKGTGLGLATVYGIVQQHNGWIKASSTVNKETVFQIFLPAIASKSAENSDVPEVKIRGGNETILIVEDEPPLRILVKNVLERYGYHVLEAVSGLAALVVWEQHKDEIQLVLTDMVMPHGVSGRELALKLQDEKPDLKVIYSSGYSLAVVGKDMVLEEGLNFLQKPYHPRKLAQAVRDCLDAETPKSKV